MSELSIKDFLSPVQQKTKLAASRNNRSGGNGAAAAEDTPITLRYNEAIRIADEAKQLYEDAQRKEKASAEVIRGLRECGIPTIAEKNKQLEHENDRLLHENDQLKGLNEKYKGQRQDAIDQFHHLAIKAKETATKKNNASTIDESVYDPNDIDKVKKELWEEKKIQIKLVPAQRIHMFVQL